MARVAYIAGYGRSGSTVLDIVLGAHPDLCGVGELSLLVEDWGAEGRVCSCHARYPACPFWSGLPVDPGAPGLREVVRGLERAPNLPRLVRGRVSPREREVYRRYHDALFSYVLGRSGGRAVLDSSKSARWTAGRSLALAMAGHDVRVLHLVRGGLATLESVLLTGSNWELEGHGAEHRLPALRAASGWLSANLLAGWTGRRLGAGHYLLVRYEDLVADPVDTLSRIGRFLELDMTDLSRRAVAGEAFGAGHRVGGNRVRLEGTVSLRPPRPGPPGTRLRPHQRLLFSLTAGWLDRRYVRAAARRS